MNPQYLPQTPEGRIDRLVEEAGEVLMAIGKLRRFGPDSRHPDGGPSNIEQLKTELRDLRHAIGEVEDDLYAGERS